MCVCVCDKRALRWLFPAASRTPSAREVADRGQGPVRAGGKVPGTIAYRRGLASYVEDTQGLSMV